MSEEGYEVEGVRILGAQEAQEKTKDSKTRTSRKAKATTDKQTKTVELPHWSEAPTGEVPSTTSVVESNDGWEALTGSQPRIRVDQNDWNEADYDPNKSLNDEELNVGSLGQDHIDLADSDENFEKELASKRQKSAPAVKKIDPKLEDEKLADIPKEKIAKISTVPDSASTMEPISGKTQAVPGGKSRKKPAAKIASRETMKIGEPQVSDAKTEEEKSVVDQVKSETTTLVTRTLTAAGLGVVAVICFFIGTIPALILSAVIVALMSIELCNAFRAMGSKPATLLVATMSFFAVFSGYLIGDRSIAVSSFVFLVFASLWYLVAVKARPVIGMAMSALAFVYVGLLGSFAGMLLSVKDAQGQSVGVFALVSVILCVTANDTAAYLFGKFAGKTPLAPTISPNKTVEGTFAGILAAILVGFFIGLTYSESIWGGPEGGVVLGIIAAVAAIFGDLIESMLKRDCKLKDFGTILPGHGGLMDRFDGLLFALPAAYYFATLLG